MNANALRGQQLTRLVGDWRGGGPDYAALATAIRGLLIDGRLPLAVRLPAERETATALGISRTTVSAAYALLRDGGFLVSRRGAGSYTALPTGHRMSNAGLWSPSIGSGVGPGTSTDANAIDLGFAAPHAPDILGAVATEAVGELPRYAAGSGYHPDGLPVLRSAIAEWYTARGVTTSPEQIVVTSGTQSAIDLTMRLLVAPGQGVLVESPTYVNALATARLARARLSAHGLGIAGWDGELLVNELRRTGARLAYLVPDFHNPTGFVMPAELRGRVVAAAHAAGTDIVVDETFVELPLDDVALPPPLAATDRYARVLSVGGMSKAYWGGLRIGWVRASVPVAQRLAALRAATDMGSPVLEQLIAVRLLARSAEILPRRRAALRERRDALVEALRRHLPDWRFAVPDGGVSLWVELDAPISSALCRAAEGHGLRLAPGPRFGLDGTLERFVRLPFTRPPEILEEAIRRLAAARGDLDAAPTPRWDQALIA